MVKHDDASSHFSFGLRNRRPMIEARVLF